MRGNIVGKVKVAVIQAASVLFDKTASIEKACDLIEKAGNKGAKIVLLPEAFIPAYPRGFTFGMKIGSRNEEGRALWKRYWENAIETSDLEVKTLGKAAKDSGEMGSSLRLTLSFWFYSFPITRVAGRP